MNDETDDDDMSQADGETVDGDMESEREGEAGSEGEEKIQQPKPRPTEFHNSALFMAKYLDQKLDKLFATTEKIIVDMKDMEKRIMSTIETNMKIERDAVSLKLIALQNLAEAQGKMIRDVEKMALQQSTQSPQMDELQKQEDPKTGAGSKSQGGTEEGTESEAGTESETGGETTEAEETEGEEEVEE